MSFGPNALAPHKVASTPGDASPKVIADLEGLSARLNSVQRRANGTTTIIQQITNSGGGSANIFAGAGLSFEADQQTLDVNVDNATLNILADILSVKNKGIGPTQLADTAVTPGTYGSASAVSVITIDQQGRITSAATTSIAIAASQITSGTLAVARGGTNIGSYTTGDILYASSSTVLTKLAIGSTGNILTVAGGIPSWAAPATSGTVTSFSAGNLSPLFTSSVANATTTPALTFTQVSQSANLGFFSPDNAAGNPTFRAFAPRDWAASPLSGSLPYASSATATAYLGIGANGTVLTSNGTTFSWAAPATSGTVTSVGLSMPSIFTVSGSPVTSTGTLTAVLATQSANTGFMGPTSGAAATPTFRALVSADIPLNTIAQAGAVATAPNDSTKFWRGDATWAVPSDTVNGSSLVFAQTSPVTVATNSETTLASTGVGSLTLPAGSVTVGQVFTLDVLGVRSTQLATTPTLTFNIYIGSVKIGTCAITDVGNLSNQGWSLRLKFTVINAGASGSVECQGYATFETGSAVALPVAVTNTAVVGSIDFTTTKLVDVKSQWGSGSQSITCRLLALETDLLAGTILASTVAGAIAGRILYDNGTNGVWNTAGSDTQTLRMNGTVPTFNSILTNDGTGVTITPTSTNKGLIVTAASGTTNYAAVINTTGTSGLQITNSTTPGAGSGGGMSIASTGTPSANAQLIAVLAFQAVISGSYQTAADILVDSRQAWSTGNAGGSMYFRTVPQASTTPTERIRIWDDGSVSVARSGSALATSATTGQFFGPNMAGIPTGAPTRVQTGSTAQVHDTTNKKLWANSGSGGTTWQGVNGQVIVSLSPAANSTTAIAATTDYEAVTTPATGTCTVTLPDAATRGPFILYVRSVTGGTVNLLIARAGSDTINGGTTSITLTVGQAIQLIANGTDWQTVSSKSGTSATQP